MRSLIYDYPPVVAIAFLQLFDEFGFLPITPSLMEKDRYSRTIGSLRRLTECGLARELSPLKNQKWAGRPAKAYRLIIPSL